MSVKSTVSLTREEAEQKHVDLELQTWATRMLKSRAAFLSNEALENALERMNDAIHNGEGFENYSIVRKP